MYKIFIREIGSTLAPTAESYDILTAPPFWPHVYAIFDPSAVDISRFVESPKLTTSAEEAGSCTFTVIRGHPFYSLVQPFQMEVLVYEDTTCIWIGRIVDVDIDKLGYKSVTAEGAKAALNDIYATAYNDANMVPRSWYLSDVFDVYIGPALNGNILDPDDPNAFPDEGLPNPKSRSIMAFDYVANDLDPDHDLDIYLEDGFDYVSVKEVIEAVSTKYGGYFYIEPYAYSVSGIDYVISRIKYSYDTMPDKLISSDAFLVNFVVNLTENITDISRDFNIESFATAVYPLGAHKTDTAPYQGTALERYTIAGYTTIPTGFKTCMSQMDGRYIYLYNEAAVQQFGWIEKVVKYDDLTNPDDIIKEAAKDLTQYLLQSACTNLTFEPLLGVVNSNLKRNPDATIPVWPRIYDHVIITSPLHGLNNAVAQILDLDIDLAKPYESTVSVSVQNYRLITKLIK